MIRFNNNRIGQMLCLAIVLLLTLSLAACGGAGATDISTATGNTSQDLPQGKAVTLDSTAQETADAKEITSAQPLPPSGDDVKLIYRATRDLEATDFDNTVNLLNQLVTESRGYFESSELQLEGADTDSRYGHFTIRVPQSNYTSFLDSMDSSFHVISL